MHARSRLSLAMGVASLLAVLTACDPDPPLCAESKGSLTLPELEAGWCTQPQQVVTPEGYCECTERNQSFDTEAGACEVCTPTSCDGKECGSDGCDGTCGRCRAGLVCVNGRCAGCEGQCGDRQCGDDGCGRSCGTCTAGSVCDEGRCVPKDDSQVVTDCTCGAPPLGAFPSATRPEPQCPAGYAQFEYCTNTKCGTPGVAAWRETCFEVPTGYQIAWCTCVEPPDGASSFWRDGRRVDTAICTEKVARIFSCRMPCPCGQDYYGNPIPCQWPAWSAFCDKC